MALHSFRAKRVFIVFIFLMVVQAIVAALLVGVILMQKSEGGGLGTGGSPTGFMSARGAADFMSRTTSILATIFVVLSIVLAALATSAGGGRTIDTSLKRDVAPVQAPVDPLAPAAGQAAPQPAPQAT
nr:preprotein translocase subunit SecG [Novosphingobium aerophilum]